MPQPTRPEPTIPTTTRSLQGPMASFMQVIWAPGPSKSCFFLRVAAPHTSTKHFLVSGSLTQDSAQGFAGTRRISLGRRSLRFTCLLLSDKSIEENPFDIWKGLAHLLKPNDLHYSSTRSIRLIKKGQGYFDGRRKPKFRGGHDKGPAPSLHHQASTSSMH